MRCGMLVCIIVSSVFFYDRFLDIHSSNLIEKLPYYSEWELKKPTNDQNAEIHRILTQDFSYQGEGGQSYVFTSKDQKYVLKLFKYKRFRPAWYIPAVPSVYPFKESKEKHIAKRATKLQTVFMGHKVAYENIQKESGLIFVQLNPTFIPQPITFTDKLGFTHQLDLGKTAFVLQKKGEMLSQNFAKLLNEGKIDQVKERIDKLLQTYVSEYVKGIYDEDHGVMQNFGFIDDQPFHLDLGKFKIDNAYQNPLVYREDLIKVSNKICIWVQNNYPQYENEITNYIEEQLSKIFTIPL